VNDIVWHVAGKKMYLLSVNPFILIVAYPD